MIGNQLTQLLHLFKTPYRRAISVKIYFRDFTEYPKKPLASVFFNND